MSSRPAMSFHADRSLDHRRAAPPEIAAEAASEFARGAAYDDLWRDPRREAHGSQARNSQESLARPSRLPAFAAIAAIVGGAMAMIGLRERIVRILPPTAAVYASAGLPVNLAGLELRSLKSRIVLDGARKVLTIEGEIVNLRREANHVPPMALTVRGENGQDKYAWTAQAPKSRLEPGEKIAFRARLASPPPDGADVLVRFAGLEQGAPQGKPAPAKK